MIHLHYLINMEAKKRTIVYHSDIHTEISLEDLGAMYTVDDIINHYSTQYPELINCKINYDYDENGEIEKIKLEKVNGTKG